jgi:hypothetical protein
LLGLPDPEVKAIVPRVTALELPTFALDIDPVPVKASVSPPCKLSKVGVNEPPETAVVPSYSLDNVTLSVLGTTVTFIVAPVKV